jgi:hypothetical protein
VYAGPSVKQAAGENGPAPVEFESSGLDSDPLSPFRTVCPEVRQLRLKIDGKEDIGVAFRKQYIPALRRGFERY